MSAKCGTLLSKIGSADSKPAHKMGNAEFFAPEIVISPLSGLPPVMTSLSIIYFLYC
jgi:hypothetical protein